MNNKQQVTRETVPGNTMQTTLVDTKQGRAGETLVVKETVKKNRFDPESLTAQRRHLKCCRDLRLLKTLWENEEKR